MDFTNNITVEPVVPGDSAGEMQQQSTSSDYFAAQPPDKTAGILLNKASSYFDVLRSNSYLDKLASMWRAYHGAYGDYVGFGHKVNFTGEQGELVHLPVNHFRNIASHMRNMICANRPMMEARAVNTDYKSLAQTYLANGILDYYMREKHLEPALKKAVELAIVLGAGFIKLEWNATAGETYDFDEETGQFNYEGEIEFSNLSPFDVVVDGTKESWNNEWVLIRTWQNRYNLMAKYPEMAEKIKGLPSKTDSTIYRMAVFSNDETDDIPVYEFYHKRTEAMPEGRYMLFVSEDVVLLDINLPYRVIPIFRMAADEILGTPYGYSSLWDCFPLQEMLNSTYSAIATNQNAFAVQNMFVKRGSDITVNSLEGGLNIIEGNEPPMPLQMTATAPETFQFVEMLERAMETISGVNSVARGNPEASLKSGSALALVQSMALQFISGLQQSYVHLVESVGTALIQILKDYATTPKIVALVGRNNRPLLKEFTGEQLSSINRVVVDLGNPLSRTIAGRVQMAEQLAQMKLLKNPEQYFQVMNTGRLDVTFEGEMQELFNIKQENERMLDGEPVIATFLDAHTMHIMEHKSVLADPELRKDPMLTQNALEHIQQHIELLRTTDPGVLMLIGEQPLPPPMPPMMMGPDGMPPEQGQGGPPKKSVTGKTPSDQLNSAQDTPEQLGNSAMPNMPKPPAPFENAPISPADMQ